MRLPWPFRRSAPDGGATAPAVHGTVQRAMAPVRRDWARTGDLRPSFVGDPGIRVQRFPDDIAGSQLPPPILAPLGHERTADGPAGLVTGLARPTLAGVTRGSTGRVDLPLRQRRTPAPMVQRAVADEPSADDPEPAPGVAMEADGAGLPVIEPRRVASTPALPPTTRVVSLTVARTPDMTLAPVRPMLPDDTSVAARVPLVSAAGPASLASAAPTTGSSMRTILRTSSGSRVRLGPPIQRSVIERGLPPLDLAHPGREASEAHAATPVQRHPAPVGATDERASVGHTGSDAPLIGGMGPTMGEDPLIASATRGEMAPVIPGGLVLARAVAGDDQDPPPAVQRWVARPVEAPGSIAPLVGAASTAPSLGLRPTLPSPVGSPPSSVEAGVPVARARAGAAREAPQRTAQRATVGGIQRPLPALTGVTTALPSSDRSGVSSAPSTVARVTGARPDAGEARPATGASTSSIPSPELVLARTPAGTVASANDQPLAGTGTGHEGIAASRLAVLRDATDPATAAPDAAEPDTAETRTPAADAGSASAPSAGGTAGAPATIAERELDEMVRRLYPRLRRSLSSELLVARERAGTLADLR